MSLRFTPKQVLGKGLTHRITKYLCPKCKTRLVTVKTKYPPTQYFQCSACGYIL